MIVYSQLQQSSRAELMRVLKVLNQTLEPKTFLVGESITLADLAVATAVLLPFKYVCILCHSLQYYTCFQIVNVHLSSLKNYMKSNKWMNHNYVCCMSSFDYSVNHLTIFPFYCWLLIKFLGIGVVGQGGLDQCYQVVHNLH